MPTLDRHLALVLLVATFALVAILLVAVLVGSTVMQQRRYLRSRERLGRRLLEVQDEERSAIARELHDDTVQRLVSVAGQLRTPDAARISRAVAELDSLANSLRGLARGIHPTLVDHVGLGEALQELSTSVGEREEMAIEYTGNLPADALSPRERLALYRVAQEALGNIARHARVGQARMQLSTDERGVLLVIEDHGTGYDSKTAASGPGIGITSMRERVEILGGSLRIDSEIGAGTRVVVTLPRKAGT